MIALAVGPRVTGAVAQMVRQLSAQRALKQRLLQAAKHRFKFLGLHRTGNQLLQYFRLQLHRRYIHRHYLVFLARHADSVQLPWYASHTKFWIGSSETLHRIAWRSF